MTKLWRGWTKCVVHFWTFDEHAVKSASRKKFTSLFPQSPMCSSLVAQPTVENTRLEVFYRWSWKRLLEKDECLKSKQGSATMLHSCRSSPNAVGWRGSVKLQAAQMLISLDQQSRTPFGMVLSPWGPAENVDWCHWKGCGASRLRVSLGSRLLKAGLGVGLDGFGSQSQCLVCNDSRCPWSQIILQQDVFL